MKNEIFNAAWEMARKDRYILPVGPDKRSIIKDWPNTASKDYQQIKAWFNKPIFGVGVLTGSKSSFFCLDVDGEQGKESLRRLEEVHGAILPETACIVKTPSAGLHFYFAMPQGLDLRNSAGKLGSGLDIRANGGYVVVPPSIIVNRQGKKAAYIWLNPAITLSRGKLPEAPTWLLNLIIACRKPLISTGLSGRYYLYRQSAFRKNYR